MGSSLDAWRDDGGDADAFELEKLFVAAMDGSDGRAGSGGRGMAGGGDGSDATDADFRKFDVMELLRCCPSACGDWGRCADFIVLVREVGSTSLPPR